MPDISEKALDRMSRVVGKMLPKKLFDKPLEQQVAMARKMMGLSDMPTVRKNILKGLPEDIAGMQKAGKSKDEIKTYYWGCEAFREFWKLMEMEEATLDVLIEDALQGG